MTMRSFGINFMFFSDGTHNDGKEKTTENRKRKIDYMPITSTVQTKTLTIEVPPNAPVVTVGKKQRLILAKILPKWDPPPNEMPTATTTSSSRVGNVDNKPSLAQVVAKAVSKQLETNASAQITNCSQFLTNSNQKKKKVVAKAALHQPETKTPPQSTNSSQFSANPNQEKEVVAKAVSQQPETNINSSNFLANPKQKKTIVAKAASQQQEKNTPAQNTTSSRCPANSNQEETIVAIKNNGNVPTTGQGKLKPSQKQFDVNFAWVPGEDFHPQILPKKTAKKGRIHLIKKPSRCSDSNPVQENNSTASVDMSGDASSSASPECPPTIDLPNNPATNSLISLHSPFPETKVKSIFDISDLESSSSKKNLPKVNHPSPTEQTNPNTGLQPLSDSKVVWYQSEEGKEKSPQGNNQPSSEEQAQSALLPMNPICQAPNKVIPSPVVWTLTSEIGNLTSISGVVPTVATGSITSMKISNLVQTGASTIRSSSISNTSGKIPLASANSSGQPKVDPTKPNTPAKKKYRSKETTAPSFVPCPMSMIDLVLKNSKDVDVEKEAATEKNPPQPSTTKRVSTATERPQPVIKPDVKPEASMATRISTRRDQRKSEHQQTSSGK